MQAYMSVIAITGALAAGAVSPGPSFIYVARNAISLSRQHGFATALGMGSGACTFAIIALLGLHAVFTAVPFAFWLLKIVVVPIWYFSLLKFCVRLANLYNN